MPSILSRHEFRPRKLPRSGFVMSMKNKRSFSEQESLEQMQRRRSEMIKGSSSSENVSRIEMSEGMSRASSGIGWGQYVEFSNASTINAKWPSFEASDRLPHYLFGQFCISNEDSRWATSLASKAQKRNWVCFIHLSMIWHEGNSSCWSTALVVVEFLFQCIAFNPMRISDVRYNNLHK